MPRSAKLKKNNNNNKSYIFMSLCKDRSFFKGGEMWCYVFNRLTTTLPSMLGSRGNRKTEVARGEFVVGTCSNVK